MDFSLSDEQEMLRDTLTRYLGQRYVFDAHRPRDDAALWRAMADDLGILGASLPESAGGLGGGAVETMVVMEALGSALATIPYLESVVLAGGLLKRLPGDRAAAILADIAAGRAQVAIATAEPDSRQALEAVSATAAQGSDGWRIEGEKIVVAGAPDADWLIVSGRTGGARRDVRGVSLFLVARDAEGVTRHDYRLIDGKGAADLAFAGTPGELLGEEGGALPLLELVRDEALAALCAEAAGLARRMLDDTVAYTKERRQFGQPLSSFQALQHRMVDMFMAVEQIASAAYLATLNLDAETATRVRAVSAAKATVSDALRFVAQNAVQLHGAMGMTEELAVGHYFRRATALEQQLGGADHHVQRYAALMRDELAA